MVMIPKPGKDHTLVKGWRPIVLANTMEKWAEKIIAQDLGDQPDLWHPLSFAGRKQRGAMDSVMLMDEIRKKTDGVVYGSDIKAAFNSLERQKMITILEGYPQL